jgi:hypothetical protein
MKRCLATLPVFLVLASALQAATPAGWHTYHDALGVTVSFPGDWKADADSYQVDFTPDGEPSPRTRLLTLAPGGDLDPGSTLNSSSVSIAILPLPPSRSQCTAGNFIAVPSPDSGWDFDADTPGYAHTVGSDPGGWYTFENYVWRISTKPCIGVHYTIGYHADGSDQAKSEKPFDRAKLLKLLDAIRATVVLAPVR